MHKLILKIFEMFINICKTLQLAALFCIFFLSLYWIETIINANWSFINFIKPVLRFFVSIGQAVSDLICPNFNAVYEPKYFIAIAVLLAIYVIFYYLCKLVEKIRGSYKSLHDNIMIHKENLYNKALAQTQVDEQKKIYEYHIYVEAAPKKKTQYSTAIDMEEQNRIMNKFLIEKTGVAPEKYGEGFLYKFYDMERIDRKFDVFSRLLVSKAPLDYIICVQIIDQDRKESIKELSSLISLRLLNTMIATASTLYRYKFNRDQGYSFIRGGLYQKENGTIDVYTIKSNNIV